MNEFKKLLAMQSKRRIRLSEIAFNLNFSLARNFLPLRRLTKEIEEIMEDNDDTDLEMIERAGPVFLF